MRNASSVALSNGVRLPLVGFGCAGYVRRGTLKEALSLGYELFDTAQVPNQTRIQPPTRSLLLHLHRAPLPRTQATEWYLEEELGHAIDEAGANRSRLFLMSKLHPRDLGEASTLAAFPTSLRRLRTDYMDAFLLHYPRCFGELCAGRTDPAGDWRGSWRALEALYDSGAVRAIGVSNFAPSELSELLSWARVRPHLVQSWMDPLHQERPLRALCADAGVTFQAYSSLGTQHRTPVGPSGRGSATSHTGPLPVLGRPSRRWLCALVAVCRPAVRAARGLRSRPAYGRLARYPACNACAAAPSSTAPRPDHGARPLSARRHAPAAARPTAPQRPLLR